MKLTDFKKGDKFTRPGLQDNWYVYINKDGDFMWHDGDDFKLNKVDLRDNWEHYEEPKEERKPETWYRFEWKYEGGRPVTGHAWFRTREDHMKKRHDDRVKDFDVEPRVYEERIF